MTLQLANFESERRGWDQQMELKGEEPSDQGFQDALKTVIAQKPEQANLARALLQMQIASEAREDKKEYQALIFGGNTTDEVSLMRGTMSRRLLLIILYSLLRKGFGTRMLLLPWICLSR